MLKLFLREAVKRALRPFSLDVRRIDTLPSWEFSFGCLKQRDFRPRTVFDIGVAAGTPQLYKAFPDAFYYLIEPTQEALPHIREAARALRHEILNVALGDQDGETTINVRADDIGASSLFTDHGPVAIARRYKVPMRRLDALVSRVDMPALCKIDVQGAELMVLRGMAGLIPMIDVFVIEVSTIATLVDGPELSDIVAFMKQHRFTVFDIMATTRRPLDKALCQADLMFVRQDSPLRADRRWAASE